MGNRFGISAFLNSGFAFAFRLLFLFSVLGCTARERFSSLEIPPPSSTILYLIRPVGTSMAIWDYDLDVYKYRRHFKEEKEPEKVASVSLSNGTFWAGNFPEGFYKISLRSDPSAEKILLLKKDRIVFLEFLIFNKNELSGPEYFLKEVDQATALEALLENEKLFKETAKFYSGGERN
ncbi:hypothetical protein EHO60_02690 [Leptospira fletcheri]|uniref:Uncharacterized protein n=1 Tax=Leptospira fletcheri TaxID=2484981 RepID=A0A4R9GJ76_9LEPT|nr:hypothetical protein [Leptospira fletcheri]TGK13125.1 hypothetical protein EHO60_02690 [Leptospira fletcheri]